VVRPPRERPIACSCSPLFRRWRSDALIEVESIDTVRLSLPQLTKPSKIAPQRPRLAQRLKRL
jgi:hypothetical protein